MPRASRGRRWGCRLYGRDSGLDWFDREGTRDLRCRECNSYDEEFVLAFRPTGPHAAELAVAARSSKLLSTREGFVVFDDGLRDWFCDQGVASQSVYSFGAGAYAFDLSALANIAVTSTDYSRARLCETCGRTSGVWPTKGPSDAIVLAASPLAPVVRSDEWFNVAYNRGPDIFVQGACWPPVGLPSTADHQVEVSASA